MYPDETQRKIDAMAASAILAYDLPAQIAIMFRTESGIYVAFANADRAAKIPRISVGLEATLDVSIHEVVDSAIKAATFDVAFICEQNLFNELTTDELWEKQDDVTLQYKPNKTIKAYLAQE